MGLTTEQRAALTDEERAIMDECHGPEHHDYLDDYTDAVQSGTATLAATIVHQRKEYAALHKERELLKTRVRELLEHSEFLNNSTKAFVREEDLLALTRALHGEA